MFGLEDDARVTSAKPPLVAQPSVHLATARSALALLARELHPTQVWLPSYLCDVVIAAFPASIDVRFYPVDGQLQVPAGAWVDEIRSGDLFVAIDYFGFTTWREAGRAARSRGAWIVEDACQAFLNPTYSPESHYVIASPRKFVGVPDGGLLIAADFASLPIADLPLAPAAWSHDALTASQLRREFDGGASDRRWFALYQASEAAAPVEPARMSELTERILAHSVDYARIATRRCNNYELLATQLHELALFPTLPPGVVPLGFPIRIPARDATRQRLFAERIYPPVHWPIARSVPAAFAESHALAAEIMTLPCDQRCGATDMRRVADVLLTAIAAGPER